MLIQDIQYNTNRRKKNMIKTVKIQYTMRDEYDISGNEI